MKTHQDPLKTTIKGVNSTTNVRRVVQRIQNKIIDHGLCSDQELKYLQAYTDWHQVNSKVESNLG